MTFIAKRTTTAVAALALVSAIGVAVAQSQEPQSPPAMDPVASAPMTERMNSQSRDTSLNTQTTTDQTSELPPRADRG